MRSVRSAAVLLLTTAAPLAATAIPPEPEVGDLLDAARDAVDLAPLPRIADTGPLTIDLRWPGPAVLAIDATADEVVVRYDRRLDSAAAADFARAAGDRLARFDWAYDALVIRARPGMTIAAERIADGVRVTFTPIATAVEPSDDATLLALIGAQADAAAGYPGRARRTLARLHETVPGDRAVTQALAEAELASDRLADGARRYATLGADRAAVLDPRLLDRARRAAGARVEAATTLRDGRGFDQYEASIRASGAASAKLAIEGGARVVRTSAAEIITAAGRAFDVARSVGIGELGVAFRPAPGVRVRALVAGLHDGDVFGGAVTGVAGNPELQATARLAWRLPDFATAEGAMLGGYLNRAAAGVFVRPMAGLGIRAEAGINRYGLSGSGVVAHSTTAELAAEWLARRQQPTIAVVYRLDAEYVGWHKIRSGGHPFLPLQDRENHTGELVAAHRLSPTVTANAAGGWTVDRFGGNGPSASAGVRVTPGAGWEAVALAGISSTSRPDQRDRQIFGRLALVRRFRGGA